jgi:hypothetical protein
MRESNTVGISMANAISKPDNSGLHTGTIIEMDTYIARKTEKNGDQYEYEACRTIIQTPATPEPIDIKIFTGSKVNNQPVDIKYPERKDKRVVVYNRFTTLLLKMEIITVADLDEYSTKIIDKITKGMKNIIGKNIKFKVGIDKNRLFAIHIDTITLV